MADLIKNAGASLAPSQTNPPAQTDAGRDALKVVSAAQQTGRIDVLETGVPVKYIGPNARPTANQSAYRLALPVNYVDKGGVPFGPLAPNETMLSAIAPLEASPYYEKVTPRFVSDNRVWNPELALKANQYSRPIIEHMRDEGLYVLALGHGEGGDASIVEYQVVPDNLPVAFLSWYKTRPVDENGLSKSEGWVHYVGWHGPYAGEDARHQCEADRGNSIGRHVAAGCQVVTENFPKSPFGGLHELRALSPEGFKQPQIRRLTKHQANAHGPYTKDYTWVWIREGAQDPSDSSKTLQISLNEPLEQLADVTLVEYGREVSSLAQLDRVITELENGSQHRHQNYSGVDNPEMEIGSILTRLYALRFKLSAEQWVTNGENA